MTARLVVDPEIFAAFPDYEAEIVQVRGVANGPSDDASTANLDAAVRFVRERLGNGRPADHPHIAAWRAAYGQFGSKPSRYPCSAEALLKRALSGSVPTVNRLVDLYNAVSLRFVLPVGGEDLDQLDGTLVLKLATGTELFESTSAGETEFTAVPAGEPIWIDDSGVTCRRWNWRQAPRTALREDTGNAFFVLDSFRSAETETLLDLATEELVAQLRVLAPACEIEHSRHVAADAL